MTNNTGHLRLLSCRDWRTDTGLAYVKKKYKKLSVQRHLYFQIIDMYILGVAIRHVRTVAGENVLQINCCHDA